MRSRDSFANKTQLKRRLNLSDALRYQMRVQRDQLAAVAKLEPIYKCGDCKRDIPRNELPMGCSKCQEMICINCVDKHDHIHEALLEAMKAEAEDVV